MLKSGKKTCGFPIALCRYFLLVEALHIFSGQLWPLMDRLVSRIVRPFQSKRLGNFSHI